MSSSCRPWVWGPSWLMAFGLAGCAASYVPPSGTPTVPVKLARGSSPSNFTQNLRFIVYSDAECRNSLGDLGVMTMFKTDPLQSSLPAGSPFYLRAISDGVQLGPGISYVCTDVARLTLEAGYRYEFRHNVAKGWCGMSASRAGASSETPQPMALEPVPLAGACKLK